MLSNYRILICCICHFQSGSLFFILASSVCKSLHGLIFSLTQGGKDGHFFRLTRSVVLWVGRNTASKYHWCMWGVLTVYGPHWACPSSQAACAFPGYTAQAPGCSAGVLSKAGPASCALPRSKLLRFRFSGTPQITDSVGHVFCALPRSEQLRQPGAWQVHCPRWTVHLNHLPSPGPLVSWVCRVSPLGS